MSRQLVLLLLLLMMTGCDPQLNLAGAYIPGWLACLLGGLLSFWIIHVVFLKTGMIPFIKPLPLVYGALMAALSCLLWLIFFSAR
jgi:hypothetical protein